MGEAGESKSGRKRLVQVRELLRLAGSEQLAQDPSEVVGDGGDEIALPNLRQTAEPGPPRPAGFEDVRESPLDLVARSGAQPARCAVAAACDRGGLASSAGCVGRQGSGSV